MSPSEETLDLVCDNLKKSGVPEAIIVSAVKASAVVAAVALKSQGGDPEAIVKKFMSEWKGGKKL